MKLWLKKNCIFGQSETKSYFYFLFMSIILLKTFLLLTIINILH